MTAWRPLWPVFRRAVRRRLERGARDYGDRSFARPLPTIADEIEQELLDVAGWAFVAYCRVRALRDRMQAAEIDPNAGTVLRFDAASAALIEQLCERLQVDRAEVFRRAIHALDRETAPEAAE
ncbi:MAG TPA: hypothetical protein VKZ49_19045 [Polyangiaceae bacterium]|nr:hypothetical protein [Polyangiaceae bacterium]